LLTKPPTSHRARLCRKLLEASEDARIYLFGDGVYNLLGKIASILSGDRIYACKEDMDARGIIASDKIVIPEDFYVAMTEDIMESNNQVYVF
jgi:tRNA 2-thiouridine synthesizing protein B